MSTKISFTEQNIIPDFGYTAPKRTKNECSNPQFMDRRLHRLAVMKKEHFGSPGDRDPCGAPGYASKFVCVGCRREFKSGWFHIDKVEKQL